jgi:hypothetical protein
MPEIANVVSGNTITSSWGNAIRDRTVQRYATAAARTSGHPSPVEGDLSYLQDSNTLWYYNGTAWVPVGLPEVANAVEQDAAVPISGMTTVATVNLTIPAHWLSWACYATASFVVTPISGSPVATCLIVIDGTITQSIQTSALDMAGTPMALVAYRTGITTTGARAIGLRITESSGDLDHVKDISLYARATQLT